MHPDSSQRAMITLARCLGLAALAACAPRGTTVGGPASPARTLVAVFAHPDDETHVAPMLARYAREGARVLLVIATDGRRGANRHAGIPAGDSLAKVRAEGFPESRTRSAASWYGQRMHPVSSSLLTATVSYLPIDRAAAARSIACHWSQATAEEQSQNLQALDQLWQGAVTFQQWGGAAQRRSLF